MLSKALKRALPPRVRAALRGILELVHQDLQATVVEKDLEATEAKDVKPADSAGTMIEVSSADSGPYLSALRRERGDLSRAKALRYLESGFRGVAAVEGGRVIGAVWSVTRDESRLPWVHGDLRRLRVGLEAGEAYMFDMYIEPEHRGMALSTSLFRAAYAGLRARGFLKAKGYYAVNNLPALWMHRVLGYREVARVRVRRILGVTWSYRCTPLAKQG